MSENPKKTMRDTFLECIYREMAENERLYFLSADFGAPALDKIRKSYEGRFLNVGVAEQNLINVAAGLAFEGATVFTYAIAPFITMRCYEQTRTNLAVSSTIKPLNVNLIGVGAGVSYDVSGPTHHCLEDITLMRMLPGFSVFSPSDWKLAEKFFPTVFRNKHPKYIRFDSKPLPAIYETVTDKVMEDGFCELVKGGNVCLVSTGYMTHRALRVAAELPGEVGVADVFMLKPLQEARLHEALKNYRWIVTLEEGFVGCGGLDALVLNLLNRFESSARVISMGFNDRYVFDLGSRDYLHRLNGMDEESILRKLREKCL